MRAEIYRRLQQQMVRRGRPPPCGIVRTSSVAHPRLLGCRIGVDTSMAKQRRGVASVLVVVLVAAGSFAASRAVSSAAVAPVASIGSASVLEGDIGVRALPFAVTLSQPASSAVSVHYTTAPGTARAGVDFVRTAGVLKIPKGSVSGFITVPVNGDRANESNETFAVKLGAPAHASLGHAIGTGTIIDNDPLPPRVRIGIGS